MNTALMEQHPWRLGRWVLLVVLVFAGHVGLIFTLGDRKPIVPRQPTFVPALRLTADSAEILALNDPTLFVLPHPNGFAGEAWLRNPPLGFPAFRWTEPPRWLALPVEQLGDTLAQFVETNALKKFPLEFKPAPELTVPAPLPPEIKPIAHSIVRIEGDLAQRRLLGAFKLPSWPGADLLANSAVQVLVDAAGHVMSVAPLPPGSGSKDADQRALDLAKTARFESLPDMKSVPAKTADRLTLGTIIFQWQTVPMPETNSAPATP